MKKWILSLIVAVLMVAGIAGVTHALNQSAQVLAQPNGQ